MDYLIQVLLIIQRLLDEEILPSIRTLKSDVEGGVEKALKKYLIVSLVGILEYFFKSKAKQYADKYDIDMSRLFKGELCLPISQLDQMLKGRDITKGSIVVSSVNFLNWKEVNSLFSKMLNLDKDFFDWFC